MTTQDIIEVIRVYDEACAGAQSASYYEVKPLDVYIADGVTLVTVGYGADGEVWGNTRALVYDTGDVFVLSDWQGGCPDTAGEIGDYDWVHAQSGLSAIMLSGLPRVFA